MQYFIGRKQVWHWSYEAPGIVCSELYDITIACGPKDMSLAKYSLLSQKNKYTRHEHRQTPTIFYLKLWTFALLFFYLDMEFLGLFGVFVDF